MQLNANLLAEPPRSMGIAQRLHFEIARFRGIRRIDLSAADSREVEDEIDRQNARLGEDLSIPAIEPLEFKGIPLRLDQPETRLVAWDDYEQLQVLSATCFTPEPKK